MRPFGSKRHPIGMPSDRPADNGKSRLGCTVAAKFSRQFSDEVSWLKVDPQAAAAASGEEDITEGGDNQGGSNGGSNGGGGNNPPGELEE